MNLTFASGQISVILGRNNSGKTNLLRLIAGLESRARGSVSLDHRSLDELPPGRRPVGLVYQAFVNYPHWTVRQNIESPMRAADERPDAASRRLAVEQIAQTLQLDTLLDRLPGELSGGQQQRLAIGRALATDASVLLLDEPFVNLDFRLRERLTEELGELLRGAGKTAIFTSSDCREAFSLADTVTLLEDQQVLQSGAPIDVYRNPVSLGAADLLSEPSVNWLSVSGQSVGELAETLEVIRPEHMCLTEKESGAAPGESLRYCLAVDAVETNGSHTFVQGRLTNPVATHVARRWVARLTGMPELKRFLTDDNVLPLFVDPLNRLALPASDGVV